MEGRRRRKKVKKPNIDHRRPFSEQVQQLQEQLRPNVVIDEVIISRQQMWEIARAWLYGKYNKKLAMLMLLYSNPDVADLAKRLGTGRAELLTALEELKAVRGSLR